MAKIIIFSVANCPKCEQLKSAIPEGDYQEKDMGNPEALTYLRCNEVFTMAAPVLQVNDQFLTIRELFENDTLRTDVLSLTLSFALLEDVNLAQERLKSEGWDDSAAIVKKLYADNQQFQRDLKNLNELNYGLMGNCNSLRSQLNQAEEEIRKQRQPKK